MLEENSQVPLTNAEVRAHLGIVTNMLQKMVPQEQPEAPQIAENEPEQEQIEQPQEVALKDLETKFMDELGTIKGMIEKTQPKDQNKELEDLKNQIKEVLNESNDNETAET